MSASAGAFTNSVISDISLKKLKQVRFVLKDPTKIFVNVMDWGVYRKKGFRLNVLKNIEIAAITVNPWSPGASWLCYFRALSKGEVNKVAPIDKSSTVLTIVLAFIFFQEGISLEKGIAVIAIFAAEQLR